MENNTSKVWKYLAIITSCLLLIVSYLYFSGYDYRNTGGNDQQEVEPAQSESYFSLWAQDSKARDALIEYVEAVTDPNNPDFIPVESRIAVFDLDGTLFCETDPTYFDFQLFLHRVTEDPDYKDKASDFEKEVAAQIIDLIENGVDALNLGVDHGRGVASAFKGFTLKEFNEYIQEFKKTPMNGYNNMNKGDAFYLPMVEVLDYLMINDFKVYIVSGTDRFIVRGIVDGISFLNIPPNQIIGSDEMLVSSNQEDQDGLDYSFTSEDQLILAGEFIVKNLKTNKVTVIAQEIGQQPVLAFGNSSSDFAMAEYAISNNRYRSMAFMLCCDDTVRENGNEAKAEKMLKNCEEYGFVPISMKNDWITIYGDEVTRK